MATDDSAVGRSGSQSVGDVGPGAVVIQAHGSDISISVASSPKLLLQSAEAREKQDRASKDPLRRVFSPYARATKLVGREDDLADIRPILEELQALHAALPVGDREIRYGGQTMGDVGAGAKAVQVQGHGNDVRIS